MGRDRLPLRCAVEQAEIGLHWRYAVVARAMGETRKETLRKTADSTGMFCNKYKVPDLNRVPPSDEIGKPFAGKAESLEWSRVNRPDG